MRLLFVSCFIVSGYGDLFWEFGFVWRPLRREILERGEAAFGGEQSITYMK
jgi:hypothetical protein